MPAHRSFYAARGKRWFDLIVTIPALILLAPVMLVVALLVRVKLGAPVLFRQVRPGWHARPFTLYKFRTMRDAVDATGRPLPDAERLTHFGKMLRSTSLDGLPELWNIVHGDMSIVGPRPLLMQYLDRYSPEQARRHDVRPGLTGYAQVHGRNAIDWQERFRLDVWYVDHVSLGLDLRIIAQTVGKLFTREGVTQPGQATMEEFQGDRSP
ncbi:MAG: sugar transferase [Anaerolineales bacterium]|nr:sugar transferase [Anaerolineales bacterium]